MSRIDRAPLSADATEVDPWCNGTRADAGRRHGVFVNIETDEDDGIVSQADFHLRKPLRVMNRRSRRSGLRPIPDHGLSEVSASRSESHTV
jgi:hypothetical protein